MNVSKRVPWYSSSEWLEVYHSLFNESIDSKRAAVSRIGVWEQKSSKVPVAITCTKLLMECYLAEISAIVSEAQLQLMYSSAIVRFVNLHVDILQQKKYAESIAVAASAIGIPSEIIGCRHQITHNIMPSLNYLRHTASLCMDYLTNRYWKSQAILIEKIMDASNQSKHLISGLTAVLEAIESMLPPKDLENSLTVMIQNLGLRSQVNVRSLLCAAAAIAGSRQKEIMKNLRKMNILGQPAFITSINWLSHIKKTLPRYLQFYETLLHSCSNEALIESFLKDFVIYAFNPNQSFAAVIFFVWTIARESPHLSLSLTKHLISSILNMIPSINSASNENASFNGTVFSPEIWSTWSQLLNVTAKESVNKFLDEKELATRHLLWMKTLLLLPHNIGQKNSHQSNNDSVVISHTRINNFAIPLSIEVFLHLFCGAKLDAAMSSPNNTCIVMQDPFTRQFVTSLTVMQARVIAGCRAMLKPIAIAASECLFTQCKSVDSIESLKSLVQIINEADIKVPKSNTSRLIEWFNQRLSQNLTLRPSIKKSLFQKFLSELPKDFVKKSDYTLGDHLHNIFWSIKYRAMNGEDEPTKNLESQIHELVNSTKTINSSGQLQQLSTQFIPWTNPGHTYSPSSNTIRPELFSETQEHKEINGLIQNIPMSPQEKKRRQTMSEDVAMFPSEKRLRIKEDLPIESHQIEMDTEGSENISVLKNSLLNLLNDLNNNFN